MKKTKSAQKQAASKSKNTAAKGASARKAGSAERSKTASTKTKTGVSVARGASATAPVVYQTLREQVAAVDSNVGTTQSLSDFLKSSGWS